MNLKISICLAGAIACHSAVLFGYRTLQVSARQLPEPDNSYLEVSLAPSAPPVAKVEEPPPPPETKPEPLPKPPPPPPTEEAVVKAPEPEPTPAPAPITPPASAPATQQVAAVTAPTVAVPNAPPGEAVVAPPSTVPSTPMHGKYLEVSQPAYLKRNDPEYPARARRARQQGTVVLALYINELGSLDKVELVQSSGHAALDEAALAAEKNSRFRPAYRGNQPVPSRAEVPYHFKLN